jgi:hypothetical protein
MELTTWREWIYRIFRARAERLLPMHPARAKR